MTDGVARTQASKVEAKVGTKAWIDTVTIASDLRHQSRIVTFLLWAYGLVLAATMPIFYLQGFHAWGFTLDIKVLLWLGGATVGEIGGLLVLTSRLIFGGRKPGLRR